ncbi:MAG TPA: class I SAM-dependent methyltransferase, partial [Pyrinomonadaceae bacterium]|nr:class I SAM-dependent methyltransferase [Pyrinomonadaceae bacterium]
AFSKLLRDQRKLRDTQLCNHPARASNRTEFGPLKTLRSLLAAPPDPFLVTGRTQRRVSELVAAVGDRATILNIGAGYTRLSERVINVDIFDSGTTDVIASALALPFPDATADLIILQGVLEHVEDADSAIAECHRVLRPGGLFYTEMPFLQPYHESPIDVRRSTRPGLAHLCSPLTEVDSGIHIGPASTLAWIIRELLAVLVSGGRDTLYRRASSLIGWVVFPLKYADYFFERFSRLHTVASSCYYIGRKDIE